MPDLGPSSPLARSAQTYILSACRLVGALRSGLSLSAAELTDSLQALNDMMDAFSAERVMIPAETIQTVDQNQNTLALVTNQQSYTLGNVDGTENFLLPRPARTPRVSILYSTSQQTPIEKPMEMYDPVQWQGIANKSTPSILPQICFVDESNAVFPDMVLYFWPVPTQANPVILYTWTVLSQFPDLQSKYLFPPAYAELIRTSLAMRLAAEFPCDLTKLPIVKAWAAEARDRVVGINARPLEAVCDEAIVGGGGKMGNIYSGDANRSFRY